MAGMPPPPPPNAAGAGMPPPPPAAGRGGGAPPAPPVAMGAAATQYIAALAAQNPGGKGGAGRGKGRAPSSSQGNRRHEITILDLILEH